MNIIKLLAVLIFLFGITSAYNITYVDMMPNSNHEICVYNNITVNLGCYENKDVIMLSTDSSSV